MKIANVDDVVAYILELTGEQHTMKLQKLLYYCHGWHLALAGAPLFNSRIEAWRYGPVVKAVYRKHRRLATVASWPDGDPARLTDRHRSLIEAVVATYGQFSGLKLANMTHEETPWKQAWLKNTPGGRDGIEVTDESIGEFFRGLANEQRSAQKQ